MEWMNQPGPVEGTGELQLGPIRSWSFSTLTNFESCPYRVYLSKVEKHPEPSSPAAERGTQIHAMAEGYVKGEIDPLPIELNRFGIMFVDLREQYAQGKVEVEEEWGFDLEWNRAEWKEAWGRMKLDVMVHEDETSARVIDLKTGKKLGNEIKHSGQGQTYAIGAFLRYPTLQNVRTEFWYADHGDTLVKDYSRSMAMLFLGTLQKRALAMTTATEFPPKPSRHNCRFCPHSQSGVCQWTPLR